MSVIVLLGSSQMPVWHFVYHSPSRSLSVPVTCPEANSISVISGLPCLFKFNLNFEKEEKSKMKLGTNTVHKIVHQATQFIYTLPQGDQHQI